MIQEGSGEIWELPGSTTKEENAGGGGSAETVARDCSIEGFLGKGGEEMELVYDYDLLYRPGADVQNDIIEMDELVARFLQNQLELSCQDDITFDNFRLLGDLPYADSGGSIYWINRGYIDVRDRAGICTSREGRTAAEYDLGCVPIKGVVDVFYQPSAEPNEVKEVVLDVLKIASLETKSKSWAVYVGERPGSETTGLVAGATDGSWTEQTIGGVTVKSILIWGGVAVFAALSIIVLGVLINHSKRKTRIQKETEQYEEFQQKRTLKKKAEKQNKEAATANKEFSEKYNQNIAKSKEEESLPEEMGYELELCMSANIIGSNVA